MTYIRKPALKLTLLVAAFALPLQALELPNLIFEDGFEFICPTYYEDGDEDDYGDPSTATEYCEGAPAGWVLEGGDCDDNNNTINPGVDEFAPDEFFTDENCDGIDGNLNLAILVAKTGANSGSCGTLTEPCLTLAAAFNRAQTEGRSQLYLQQGEYNESNLLQVNLGIYGGYDTSWLRGSSTVSRINGVTGGLGALALKVDGVALGLERVTLAGPNAIPEASDRNSYIVFGVGGSSVIATNVVFIQGDGADGAHGNPGISAPQNLPAMAGRGSDANEESFFCSVFQAAGGSGGSNPQCPQTTGGNGGKGGSMDTSCGPIFCSDCDATYGNPGFNADVFSTGSYGYGGNGGPDCALGGRGYDGRVTDGSGGSGGQGGSLLAAGWTGRDGEPGRLGDNGGGGGGGGGSGGCDEGIDSWGAGGGGGGAGGCRAPSVGTGGQSGGGSFGIHVANGAVTVTHSTFNRGTGGNGGMGGQFGQGQPGGDGGSGGSGAGGSQAGGDGGQGGRGGHSGAGGGGAGGASCGISAYSSTLIRHDNTFIGGIGGAGGNGGSGSASSAGTKGGNGAVCEILS